MAIGVAHLKATSPSGQGLRAWRYERDLVLRKRPGQRVEFCSSQDPQWKINLMSAFNQETILSVQHWTDTLFSFTATRSPSFRFQNGQFAMIGLEVDGRPLLRAYSMACAPYDEELEFLSIKVPNGPLTSRLQKIVPGDEILIGRKATGTLLHVQGIQIVGPLPPAIQITT
eukprot:gene15835-20980_t